MEKNTKETIKLITELCIVIIFFTGLLMAMQSMQNELIPHKGSIVPCDQVTTITEKYQKATDNGMRNILVANGREHIFLSTLSIDGGQSTFKKIPVGITGLLYGEVDIYRGIYITGFEPVNVTLSNDPKCVNCCVVV